MNGLSFGNTIRYFVFILSVLVIGFQLGWLLTQPIRLVPATNTGYDNNGTVMDISYEVSPAMTKTSVVQKANDVLVEPSTWFIGQNRMTYQNYTALADNVVRGLFLSLLASFGLFVVTGSISVLWPAGLFNLINAFAFRLPFDIHIIFLLNLFLLMILCLYTMPQPKTEEAPARN